MCCGGTRPGHLCALPFKKMRAITLGLGLLALTSGAAGKKVFFEEKFDDGGARIGPAAAAVAAYLSFLTPRAARRCSGGRGCRWVGPSRK